MRRSRLNGECNLTLIRRERGGEGPEIMRFRGKTRDKRQRHARNRVEKMEARVRVNHPSSCH